MVATTMDLMELIRKADEAEGDGRALYVLASSVPDDAKIGATIEPAGGSLQRTSDPILVSGV
ncbi:MAG: hypothetical protein M3O70_20425 [Actinomycetota bacterium]|nr:hypothetical protein [Actinomycetota bacterium]